MSQRNVGGSDCDMGNRIVLEDNYVVHIENSLILPLPHTFQSAMLFPCGLHFPVNFDERSSLSPRKMNYMSLLVRCGSVKYNHLPQRLTVVPCRGPNGRQGRSVSRKVHHCELTY
ncbi:hypothetical protein TNIN_316291 [Trichonephila inaurata madagascariensis]|uniref:Uncharacterized protein n=1 Tax=Trichonephila inaurata madagascariensis TaxID=2747483 RepID=A0A8X7CBJ8_9ARAC|nr:hypothetical protein TNIN_316291 [Trichonephila inaurata madagascariensis]